MPADRFLSDPPRRYRFSILRVILCSLMLAILLTACLYLYHTSLDFYRNHFLEQEKETEAWIVKQVALALPFVFITLFHIGVYYKHDRHDGIASREMAWEIAITALLVYAVLLPLTAELSSALRDTVLAQGGELATNEGGVEITLLMDLHKWFVAQIIPLGLLLVLHSTRAVREHRHPEDEVEEPLLTVDEYLAQKNARKGKDHALKSHSEESSQAS